MSEPESAVGRSGTIARGPRYLSRIALAVAVVGTLLVVVGLPARTLASLMSYDGWVGWNSVVLAGLLVDLVAIVLALVALGRPVRRRVPVAAIAVALVPVIVLVALNYRYF